VNWTGLPSSRSATTVFSQNWPKGRYLIRSLFDVPAVHSEVTLSSWLRARLAGLAPFFSRILEWAGVFLPYCGRPADSQAHCLTALRMSVVSGLDIFFWDFWMVLDGAGQHESRWAAIVSISSKIGCAPQTLNEWVKKVEIDTGQRGGITTDQAEKMKALEREVRELKQANEILRKASAYFAQAELDRPLKR